MSQRNFFVYGINVSKKLFVIVYKPDFNRPHILGGTEINIKITSTLGFNCHEFKYLQQHQ